MHAAVAANDETVVRVAVRAALAELYRSWERRVEDEQGILHRLNIIPDFMMNLSWDFRSWLPFVSRLLPHDNVVIRKRLKKLLGGGGYYS